MNLFPVAFFDAPQVLDTSVTPIPGSGNNPIQVIANIGKNGSQRIDYIDTTGDFIGVYTGPTGKETLACIIGNGVNSWAFVVLPAFSRVSLRSMTATPITFGKLQATFMNVRY